MSESGIAPNTTAQAERLAQTERLAPLEQSSADRPPVSPENMGWASAAAAIHSVLPMAGTVILRVEIAGHDEMVIDFRHHAYSWPTPLDFFPERPAAVRVRTEPTFPGAPAVFPLPGDELDPLLWRIGHSAFGGNPAPWRRPGDLYRLRRWPNLSTTPMEMEEVRMTAMLGNAALTFGELVSLSGATPQAAHAYINALSVMGILRAQSSAPPAPRPAPPAAPPVKGGLFSRLRDKLGL